MPVCQAIFLSTSGLQGDFSYKFNFLIIKLVLTALVPLLLRIVLAVIFIVLADKLEAREISPFECGFVNSGGRRQRFSMQFFVVSLIFVVFDVELVLLFPYAIACSGSSSSISLVIVIMFFIALSIRAIYEWITGMLDWLKF